MNFTEDNIPEFGIKRENEERRDGGCGVVFDPKTQKYGVGFQYDKKVYRLFSGGIDVSESIEEGILREITEESGLYDFLRVEKIGQALAHYYNSLRNVNRVALSTCYLIILKTAKLKPVKLEEHERFSLVWTSAEEILENWKLKNHENNYDHWIYFLKKSVTRAKELGYDTTSLI